VTATKPSADEVEQQPTGRLSLRTRLIGAALFVASVVFVLVNAKHDGPDADDTVVTPLWSNIDFVMGGQIAGVIIFFGSVLACSWAWQRYPRHPFLLMVIAANTLAWFDPINNWAIGLVYNPRMWHVPDGVPWLSVSPVIEPLTSIIYAPYVMLPLLIAGPLMRRLQKNRPKDAYVWRHPLISLALITFVIGFTWDAAQEMLLVRTQFLTYTHVTEFGSIWVGKNYQYPLLQASALITMPMIAAAVMLYRDEDGRTQAEKLASRFKLYTTRPATATFVVMAVILNICFITFSASFWLVRVTGAADQVACPWPYPSAAPWDPHHLYAEQCPR